MALCVPNNEMNELYKCYGIKTVETEFAATSEEAAAAADRIGYPVVIKLVSSTISHKSDVGGVALDIKTPDEVKDSFTEINKKLSAIGRAREMQGVIVQKMIKEGQEIIIGVNEYPSLGHVIMFGLGGIYAELLKDTALRLHPLTDLDVKELIDSVQMSKLLKGYRGSTPLDIASLEDLLLRVSAMVEDIPQISEMDLNPVIALPEGQGYSVVDARIMIK